MQFIPRNKRKRTKENSASTEKPDLFWTFFYRYWKRPASHYKHEKEIERIIVGR